VPDDDVPRGRLTLDAEKFVESRKKQHRDFYAELVRMQVRSFYPFALHKSLASTQHFWALPMRMPRLASHCAHAHSPLPPPSPLPSTCLHHHCDLLVRCYQIIRRRRRHNSLTSDLTRLLRASVSTMSSHALSRKKRPNAARSHSQLSVVARRGRARGPSPSRLHWVVPVTRVLSRTEERRRRLQPTCAAYHRHGCRLRCHAHRRPR